jgi:DNA-binding XRE family transcriptional regulator
MQVVVKKPRIDITGELSKRDIAHFIKRYGRRNVEVIDNDTIPIEEVPWIKKLMDEKVNPAESLKLFRKRDGLTQAELAKKVGEYKQNISGFEKGTRNISLEMAKKFGKLFGTSYHNFI